MAKWLTNSERVTINAQPKIPTYRHRSSDQNIPSHPMIGAIDGTASDTPRYSGDEIIGIATMHKSNAVPVTSKAAATDVARMRR